MNGAERRSAERGNTTVSLSRLMRLRKELRCRFNRDRRTMVRRDVKVLYFVPLRLAVLCGEAQCQAMEHDDLRSWDLHLSDAQLIKPLVLQARKRSDRIWGAMYLSLQNVLLH